MKKDIEFNCTDDNIMSIIMYLRYREHINGNDNNEIEKKYTRIHCGELAKLIKHFIPDAKLCLAATVDETSCYYYKAFHYYIMAKNNGKVCQYDINGRHVKTDTNNSDFREYCAQILNNANVNDVVMVNIDDMEKNLFRPQDKVVQDAYDGILRNPNIITSKMMLKKGIEL